MSVKIMSAIFETEFRDLELPPEEGQERPHMSKASSLKIVLLAIADHANDEGISAYPGLKRLERKTGMSRQGVIDVIKALKYNGLLTVADQPSRLGTNDYTINLECFPCLKDASQATLLVKPLDYPSQATLLGVVKPLDMNHPLTTIKPSLKNSANFDLSKAGLEWAVLAGEDIPQEGIAAATRERLILDEYERAMGYNPLPWDGSKLRKLRAFLVQQTPEDIRTFAAWSKKAYSSFKPDKARSYPDQVIDNWPQAFIPEPIHTRRSNKDDSFYEKLRRA